MNARDIERRLWDICATLLEEVGEMIPEQDRRLAAQDLNCGEPTGTIDIVAARLVWDGVTPEHHVVDLIQQGHDLWRDYWLESEWKTAGVNRLAGWLEVLQARIAGPAASLDAGATKPVTA